MLQLKRLVVFLVCILAISAFVVFVVLGILYWPGLSGPFCYCHHKYSCGQIQMDMADYQLRGQGDPSCCGRRDFQLSCEYDRSVLYLGSNPNKYYAEIVDVGSTPPRLIRVLDPGLDESNCSTIPLYSFRLPHPRDDDDAGDIVIVFVSCMKLVESPMYIDTAPCLTANAYSHTCSNSESVYSYVVVGKAGEIVGSVIEETCTIHRLISSSFPYPDLSTGEGNISYQDIHKALAAGFVIDLRLELQSKSPIVTLNGIVLVLLMSSIARAMVGIILLRAFLVYKCRRRHSSIYDTIEEFLKSRNNLVPIRYSYKEIKKMTCNFKEKLGEGGCGSVYKGRLRSGHFAAVKMLNNSKGDGQDFINEVATLGRIHHVNVVRLVGFCVTGSKCALVFDYMPNGSLDKFIFARNDRELNWNTALEIAKGVARGMEYLHQGCNMQILHFDIKPHNILLDENFVPKISDFGLAKLRHEKNNFVSMTAARGTIGYMAPELFYKRVGNVSYKADVYSFGMLLMEMAGRRRNLKLDVERSSQVYFPSWIYDQFDVQLGDNLNKEEENRIARKLILIALWCIQMKPNDRPTMKQVLEMLQGDSEDLQLPPRPLFCPPDSPVILEQASNHSSTQKSTETVCTSIEIE